MGEKAQKARETEVPTAQLFLRFSVFTISHKIQTVNPISMPFSPTRS